MPRVATTDTKKKVAAVTGTIVQYMTMRNVTNQYMADKLGITKQTFEYKMKDSGKFTVEQLIMITNILQIPTGVNLFIGASPEREDIAMRVAGIIMGAA